MYSGRICQSPEETVSIGEGMDRTYTKRYDVVLDLSASSSADITPIQVYAGFPGLPQYLDPWVSRDNQVPDLNCRMRSFTGRREHNDKSKFSFTFTYSTRGAARTLDPTQNNNRFQNTGSTDDPTAMLPVWSIRYEDRMVPMYGADIRGIKPINSAGDYYDPGLERNEPILVLNWSVLRSTLDLEHLQRFKDKVNVDDFLLAQNGESDAELWWIQDIAVTPETYGAGRFYKYDYVFKYSRIGWHDVKLDAGLFSLKVSGHPVEQTENYNGNFDRSNRTPIISPVTGQPVNRPWPLNGQGFALWDTSDRLYFREFTNKRLEIFQPLGVYLP